MPAEHVYVPNMTPLMTAEDLLKPGVPERADLVRGVLVVHEPPSFRHGEITVRLTIALGTHVDARHLGRVVAGDAVQAAIGSRYGARRRHRVRQLGTIAAAISCGLPAARPRPRGRGPLTRRSTWRDARQDRGLALRWHSTRVGDRSRAATRADLSPGRFGVDSWRSRRIGR